MTMSEKDKGKTAVTAAKKTDAKKYPVFNYTVSEGSTIILDLRQFLNDNDVSQHNLKSHSFVSCTQTSGIPIGSLEENHQTISFKAPYVRDNDVYTRLEFELRTATNDTNDITTHRVNVIVKRVQRAIVFQGGVALGAYEAGVFDALVKKISEQDEDEGRTGFGKEKRPVFDLVAWHIDWWNECCHCRK